MPAEVKVFYKIATAAADDVATVAMDEVTLPATGVAVSGAAVTITQDGDHDTAAERKATGDHTMTVTITTPFWIDDGECVWVSIVVDAALTTAFSLYGRWRILRSGFKIENLKLKIVG